MIKDTSMQDRPRQANASAARSIKGKMPMLGILLLGVLAAVFAYPSIERWSHSTLSIDAERLRTARVVRGEFIRDVSVQGQVVAAIRPMLFSPEDGRVTTLVRSGDKVNKGDALAEVESPELLNQYKQELASLEQLKTGLSRQEIETRMESLLQKKSMSLSEMALTAAKRELRRAESAYQHKAISLQDYEKAVDDQGRAEALFSHQKEESVLKSERLKLELDILTHSLTRQELLVADLQRKIDALTVLSPVHGVVGNLEVEQKSVVAKHQPLLTVVDMSAYEIEARVPESYADDLTQGMLADINFSGDKYKGELSAISPEVQDGQVRCRIRFIAEKPAGLRQNQRVSSRIFIDSRDDILMVSRGPFMQSGSRGFAYVLDDGVAVKTPIVAGMSSVGRVEILSGLIEGQEVVISSSDVFEDHDRVVLLNQ